MRIIVTGAAGSIGRRVAAELGRDHELELLDRRPVAGLPIRVVNLARPGDRGWLGREGWNRFLTGADAVLHLAAVLHPAPWGLVRRHNVAATWNVLDAAARRGVLRVVFASSGWAVLAAEAAVAPACYAPDGPKLGSVPPRPFSSYGLSKALGEVTGRMLVDQGRLRTFVAVRIGYFPRLDQVPDDEYLRRRWVAHADLCSLLRRAVEADVTGFHVVYGVSRPHEAPYDLAETERLLRWIPRRGDSPAVDRPSV